MYRLCEWTRQNEHVICIGAVSSAHTKQEQSFKLYKTDVHIFFIIFLDSFVCFLQHIAQNRVFAKEDPSLFSVFFLSIHLPNTHSHSHVTHTCRLYAGMSVIHFVCLFVCELVINCQKCFFGVHSSVIYLFEIVITNAKLFHFLFLIQIAKPQLSKRRS